METCEPEDSDQDQDDHEIQNDETQSWIGVIHIPVLEYYNARGSKSCSVLERVCASLLCFRLCQSRTIFTQVCRPEHLGGEKLVRRDGRGLSGSWLRGAAGPLETFNCPRPQNATFVAQILPNRDQLASEMS